MKTNVLYYGDNLDVLRRHIPDACIDLIYLDPPFNSSRSYNVLFRESTGAASEAQIEAFEDTWQWAPKTAQVYEEIVTGPHQQVARMLKSMVEGLGHNEMSAYLTMMAVRLVELHRALKETGSIYLHCDPTASHYLKLVMDAIFNPLNFKNEVVWKRTSSHNDPKRFGRIHDVLLIYGKTSETLFNVLRKPLDPEYVKKVYSRVDKNGRRYRLDNISAPGGRGPVYEWGGITQAWRFTKDNMEELHKAGRIRMYPDGRAMINAYVRYLDENEGQPIQDWWDDIGVIAAPAKERLGYPTQKPLVLLERIIQASSKSGDVVLDPFCGCGTAVHAAHKLGRRWVGMDVTHLAIGLVRRRMQDAFPGIAIEVIGEPVDLASAQELAKRDKYQFQWWALDRLGAQPVAGKKKGADKGIDGVIPFFAGQKEDYKRAIVSVKGGEKVNVGMVRDLVGVLEREKEPIGVLLTLEPPTQPMITEAAAAGIYHNDFWKKNYPRVQILTIEEMLAGKRPQTPQTKSPGAQKSPFAKASTEQEQAEQGELMP